MSKSSKVRALYLTKDKLCIDELDKIASQCKEKEIKPKISLLSSSLKKLFDEANSMDKSGDEEKAYVYYLRFVNNVNALKESEEYFKSFKTLEEKSMNRIKELTTNLQRRYQEERLHAMEEEMDAVHISTVMRDVDGSTEKSVQSSITKAIDKDKNSNNCSSSTVFSLNENVITGDLDVTSFKDLIESNEKILILDCRSKHDFIKRRVDHDNCIHISDKVYKGMSANRISELLKDYIYESYLLWEKRDEFDQIILYDWNSTLQKQCQTLECVYEALVKWDRTKRSKNRIVNVLKGGMRALLQAQSSRLTGTQSNGPLSNRNDSIKDISSLTYPDEMIDETSVKQPDMNGAVDINASSFKNTKSVPLPPDRSTKPLFSNKTDPPVVPNSVLVNGHVNHSVKKDFGEFENKPIRSESEESETFDSEEQSLKEENLSQHFQTRSKNIAIDRSLKPNSMHKLRRSDEIQEGGLNILAKNGKGAYSSREDASLPSLHISSPSSSSKLSRSEDSSSMLERRKSENPSGLSPRSNLKRSKSNPNLTPTPNEEGSRAENSPVINTTPTINRSLKPDRSHEIYVVSSSYSNRNTGLKNLGNTCYMNSVMQSLYNTHHLLEYFIGQKYKDHVSIRGPARGQASKELARAFCEMNRGHRSIGLHDIRDLVSRHHSTFRPNDQQDSHEFLTFLLDWLHEELNRSDEKKPLMEQNNDDLSDMVASQKAWADYKASNDSIISDLFCGQQKSGVKCSNCGKESVTFEPFFILSLPIPGAYASDRSPCTIYDCLSLYTKNEQVSDWHCTKCRKKSDAVKKIDLYRPPRYLIIHLQRFYNDGWWKKRLTEVSFPLDDFTIPFEGCDVNVIFQLYAVSNHYGTMDGGHYTAYCRKNETSWFRFDDVDVDPINAREVNSANGYILFFRQSGRCNKS